MYLIIIFERVSSEILNIMGINTARTIVGECIWAPNSLILLEKEIVISVEQMNHLNFDLSLRMCEGAEFLILASNIFIGVGFAKFRLVTARVIYLFDFIM